MLRHTFFEDTPSGAVDPRIVPAFVSRVPRTCLVRPLSSAYIIGGCGPAEYRQSAIVP